MLSYQKAEKIAMLYRGTTSAGEKDNCRKILENSGYGRLLNDIHQEHHCAHTQLADKQAEVVVDPPNPDLPYWYWWIVGTLSKFFVVLSHYYGWFE